MNEERLKRRRMSIHLPPSQWSLIEAEAQKCDTDASVVCSFIISKWLETRAALIEAETKGGR